MNETSIRVWKSIVAVELLVICAIVASALMASADAAPQREDDRIQECAADIWGFAQHAHAHANGTRATAAYKAWVYLLYIPPTKRVSVEQEAPGTHPDWGTAPTEVPGPPRQTREEATRPTREEVK